MKLCCSMSDMMVKALRRWKTTRKLLLATMVSSNSQEFYRSVVNFGHFFRFVRFSWTGDKVLYDGSAGCTIIYSLLLGILIFYECFLASQFLVAYGATGSERIDRVKRLYPFVVFFLLSWNHLINALYLKQFVPFLNGFYRTAVVNMDLRASKGKILLEKLPIAMQQDL